MALNIKNPETEELARTLAERRKEGITKVVTEALREALERDKRRPRKETREEFHRGIEEIVAHFNSLPVLDDRSPDDILGYNEQGLFD